MRGGHTTKLKVLASDFGTCVTKKALDVYTSKSTGREELTASKTDTGRRLIGEIWVPRSRYNAEPAAELTTVCSD